MATTGRRDGVLLMALGLLVAACTWWCDTRQQAARIESGGSVLASWGFARPGSPTASPPGSMTNRLGMSLVLVPAGRFTMGSRDSDPAREDDETPHRVQLTDPFYLGVHEVTVGQFRRFVESTGYRTEGEEDPKGSLAWSVGIRQFQRHPRYTWRDAGFAQTDDHPVVLVSWNDAMAFCHWLQAVEGRPYRLPTEAEWEWACRAGTDTRFWIGDSATELYQVARVSGEGHEDGRGGPINGTAPVGRGAANGFGLYDMHGNVWEWCADWYGRDFYAHSPAVNPRGPARGKERVLRGGAFDQRPHRARSANRAHNAPFYRDYATGFRVALDVR